MSVLALVIVCGLAVVVVLIVAVPVQGEGVATPLRGSKLLPQGATLLPQDATLLPQDATLLPLEATLPTTRAGSIDMPAGYLLPETAGGSWGPVNRVTVPTGCIGLVKDRVFRIVVEGKGASCVSVDCIRRTSETVIEIREGVK